MSLGSSSGDPYDQLPYESRPYPDTQPGQLSALAVLHGLEPSEVVHGRVLELGCASGGNIVPLAARFPEASFIGIDLSARHVSEGQKRIRELDLANVELRQGDLATCEISAGGFDTIICHGVYSWVPSAVQEAILRIVTTHLAPTGLAYVSYNTNPGFRLRQIVRDIFQYHTVTPATPQQQVTRGLAFLEELAHATDETRPYGQALRAEARLLAETPPPYIMGEYLAAASTPCTFHEFAARASAHGLAFLSEARLGISQLSERHADLANKVRVHAGDDAIAFEQYVDFFTGRPFRRSVLVKAERVASISRTIPVARLAGLHLATSLVADLEASDYGKAVFKHSDGRTFTTTDADVSRAFELLAAIVPRTLAPVAICAEAVPRGAHDRAQREGRVVEALLDMITSGFGTASTSAVEAAEATAVQPRAWQIARADAAAHRTWTTNLGHRVVELDDLTGWLVPRLDGRTKSGDLAKQLIAAAENGEITCPGAVTAGRTELSVAEATDTIDRLVKFCAKSALLVPTEPDVSPVTHRD